MNRLVRAGLLVATLGLVAGCGPTAEPAKSGDDADSDDSAAASATSSASSAASSAQAATPKPEPAEEGMPTKCAQAGDACYPNADFVKRLCAHDYPTVALAMFAKGTPWTRVYTAGEVRAWNASGAGSSNEKIPADEEVLIVRARKAPTGGMQVSGAGDSYDVLRWDGSCITLDKGELRFDAPARPKNARIIFKRLEIHVRDVLKEQEPLRAPYLKHRKECKGVSMGTVSKQCVTADGVLSEAVAAFVREQGGVPAPKKLPEM